MGEKPVFIVLDLKGEALKREEGNSPEDQLWHLSGVLSCVNRGIKRLLPGCVSQHSCWCLQGQQMRATSEVLGLIRRCLD